MAMPRDSPIDTTITVHARAKQAAPVAVSLCVNAAAQFCTRLINDASSRCRQRPSGLALTALMPNEPTVTAHVRTAQTTPAAASCLGAVAQLIESHCKQWLSHQARHDALSAAAAAEPRRPSGLALIVFLMPRTSASLRSQMPDRSLGLSTFVGPPFLHTQQHHSRTRVA